MRAHLFIFVLMHKQKLVQMKKIQQNLQWNDSCFSKGTVLSLFIIGKLHYNQMEFRRTLNSLLDWITCFGVHWRVNHEKQSSEYFIALECYYNWEIKLTAIMETLPSWLLQAKLPCKISNDTIHIIWWEVISDLECAIILPCTVSYMKLNRALPLPKHLCS